MAAMDGLYALCLIEVHKTQVVEVIRIPPSTNTKPTLPNLTTFSI